MPHRAIEAAPTLYPEIREAPTPPGKGEHGYYRRGDTGWIITAPVWPSYREDMEFKGNTFLSRYGRFTYDAGPKVRDIRGNLFGPADEPWRLIFQQGGAKEFSVDQIIAYRWHIRPPYREAVFPQLEGTTVYDFQCPECESGIFSATNELEAAFQLRQHLMSGRNDQHRYTPQDIKALGEELGIDLSRSRTMRQVKRTVHNQPVAIEEIAAGEEAEVDVERNQAHACEACGWAPLRTSKNAAASLRFHKMHCTGKRRETGEEET